MKQQKSNSRYFKCFMKTEYRNNALYNANEIFIEEKNSRLSSYVHVLIHMDQLDAPATSDKIFQIA